MKQPRFPAALAGVAMSMIVWGAPPTAAVAQPDVVIELNFETTNGEPVEGAIAVFDLGASTEYRTDALAEGAPIRISGATGVASQLQLRRSLQQPSAVVCEGAQQARVAASSGFSTLVITPDQDLVVCQVTVSEDVLPVTGRTSDALAGLGAALVGAGALALAVSRGAELIPAKTD